jgi:alkylation response protein AidB-like acyl-CoA dehydrogenase
MAQRGWIGITWPKAYGGAERSYVDKMILAEELCRVQAPIGYHFLGDRQVGPALIKFGSDRQKADFLPAIAKAEEGSSFCLLFSEPGAGSDLAAVTTTAVEDGDAYVINGLKTWSSGAHLADWGWLLARTEADGQVPGHLACSEFIVDMRSPGVAVKPIINMAGEHSFNEVTLDQVRVPNRYMVGAKNAGFRQIMAQVDYERAGIERLMQSHPVYSELLRYCRGMDGGSVDPARHAWVRDAVSQLEIEYSAGRLLCYQTAWTIDQGQSPTFMAALSKAFCTQVAQRVNDLATRIVGPAAMIRGRGEDAPFAVDLAESFLWGPSYTLQGGAVEILKNIIALRGLKLPRG